MRVRFQEDCVGLVLLVELADENGDAVDLTNAAIQFRLTSPSGVAAAVSGTYQGLPTAGVAKYTTTSSEFTEAGPWRVQVRLTIDTNVYFSEVMEVEVQRNLAAS